jgi:tripartite-type tricarboxylate transporter receptor subunit TctC
MSPPARLCILISALAGTLGPAAAEPYPVRTVKIIVPSGAGGRANLYARFLGQRLQEALQQAFVVEDRPGAGSVKGAGEAVKAAGELCKAMSRTKIQHVAHRGSGEARIAVL